jgi:hypothetical protein
VPSYRGFQESVRRQAKEASKAFREEFGREMGDEAAKALKPSPATDRAAKSLGAKSGEQAGDAFGDQLTKRVNAAIRKLPKVEIKSDTSKAQREIAVFRARLEEIRDAHANFDLDVGSALAQIAEVEAGLAALSANDVNVDVKVDAARAATELAAVGALAAAVSANDVDIDVDVDGAGKAAAELLGVGAAAKHAETSSQEAGGALRSVSLILLGVVTIGAAVIPMLGALAGALAAIGPIAIGAGAGLGVMVLGFSGIQNAVKAMMDVEKNGAKDAHAASKTLTAAADGVADAERSLARARENAADSAEDAARRVSRAQEDAARSIQRALRTQADAEKRLADAQRDATAAQQALRQARRDAQADLEDIADQQRQNALNERQAVLDLFNATVSNTAAQQDPGATNLEKEQAAIQLGNARERLHEIREEEQRLAAERAKGVNGSERVANAQERVVSALEAQQAAQRNLADAAESVDRARIDGAEAVSDALRAQARTAEDSADAIADAQRGLLRAQQNQRDAVIETGELGSSSMRKLQDAMGKLSPAAQAFATWLFSLRKEFYKIRAAAAESMLPGVMTGMKMVMEKYGPGFVKFIGAMGKVIGDLWVFLGKTMTGPIWQEFFSTMKDAAPLLLKMFGQTAINWLTVFVSLMEAFTPLALLFSQALLDISEKAVKWADGLEDTKGFKDFMAYVRRVGPEVADFFKALWDAAVNLAKALAPFGEMIMNAFTGILKFIGAMDPKTLGLIVIGIFGLITAFQIASAAVGFLTIAAGVFASTIGVVIAVLVLVGFGLFMLWTKSETFQKIVKWSFTQVAENAKWLFYKVLKPAFEWVQWGWKNILLPVFAFILAYWKTMARGIAWVWRTIIRPIFNLFMDVVGDDLVRAFKTAMGGIRAAWDTLKNIAKAPVKFVIDTVINHGLIDGFNSIGKFFGVKKKDRMGHIPLPKGFSRGGYTGQGGRDEPAGIVHRDEYVISSKARRRFERRAPGALDELNRTGTLPGYATGGRVVWPAPQGSRGLGYGNTYSGGRYHSGQDFPGPVGSKILAALNGVVSAVKHLAGSYGNHVIMRHAGGAETLYGHMLATGVLPGQVVAAGQQIGLLGSSGNSSGPHLHFEFRTPPGGYGNAVNPMPLLSGAAHLAGFGKMDGKTPGFFPNPLSWLRSKISKPLERVTDSPFGRLIAGFPHKALDWMGGAVGGLAKGVFNFGKNLIGDGVDAVGNLFHFGGRDDDDPPTLYDNGGMLPPGLSSVLNATGKPEPVLTPEQWESMAKGGGGFKAYVDARGTAANPDDIADAVLFAGRKMALGGVYAGAGVGR